MDLGLVLGWIRDFFGREEEFLGRLHNFVFALTFRWDTCFFLIHTFATPLGYILFCFVLFRLASFSLAQSTVSLVTELPIHHLDQESILESVCKIYLSSAPCYPGVCLSMNSTSFSVSHFFFCLLPSEPSWPTVWTPFFFEQPVWQLFS